MFRVRSYYPHFIAEETKVQRGEVNCPRPHSPRVPQVCLLALTPTYVFFLNGTKRESDRPPGVKKPRLAWPQDWEVFQVENGSVPAGTKEVGRGLAGSLPGQKAGVNKSLDSSYATAFFSLLHHPFHGPVPQSET